MACFESGTVIGMDAREAVTLRDMQGTTVRVTRGTVWLTQQDDSKDVILRAGDNWMVERNGATVLEAQDANSVVQVVGRHVDATATRGLARSRAGASGPDWRGRVARLFTPVGRAFWPYV